MLMQVHAVGYDGVMPNPSDAAVLAWSRLVRARDGAVRQVEQALKDEGLPALEWYDVLLELRLAGPLRQRDLQARLLLAQSNLSRLIDRMAAAGAVERRSCPDDRRGVTVAATRAGEDLRRRMWPVYAGAIEAAVGAKLSDAEATTVAALLGRLCEPRHGALPDDENSLENAGAT
jgi:DNA-binding MarR family transcriptional regulator